MIARNGCIFIVILTVNNTIADIMVVRLKNSFVFLLLFFSLFNERVDTFRVDVDDIASNVGLLFDELLAFALLFLTHPHNKWNINWYITNKNTIEIAEYIVHKITLKITDFPIIIYNC